MLQRTQGQRPRFQTTMLHPYNQFSVVSTNGTGDGMDKGHHVHYICIKPCIHLHKINYLICAVWYIFLEPHSTSCFTVSRILWGNWTHWFTGYLKFERDFRRSWAQPPSQTSISQEDAQGFICTPKSPRMENSQPHWGNLFDLSWKMNTSLDLI